MATEIYYFSGTGNSLHVARELQKRLSATKLIPIVSLLNREHVHTKADTVGFVFPLYFTTIPAPVRRFCDKLTMDSALYTFSVVTRIGTFCVANLNMERLLKKKGKKLDARFVINMAKNSPTGLAPGKGDKKWVEKISREHVSDIESAVQQQLQTIQEVVSSRQPYPTHSFPNPLLNLTERAMHKLTADTSAQVGYYADESCIHCGTCEMVCPSTTVRLHEGRPVWHDEVGCFYCFACFNFCPAQAILVKNKYTRKDGRYHHPAITAEDIARQKEYE